MFFDTLLKFFSKIFFFTGYVSGKNSYPKPLSKEDEQRNIELMKKGDNEAREILINHNLRLVAHIAKKYSYGNDLDDLISIGSIGLIKGVESYEPSKSTTLATFLARCIENEILMTLRSAKRYQNTVYLQDTLGVDSDGNEFSLMDLLSIKDESVFRQVEQSVLSEKLNEILIATLTQREYTIIKYRFGLQGASVLTQLQTAEKLKISRSYISRIETKALKKLREKLKNEDLY
ncbi:MAG: RNA polymerase sporulation sigma factor SigK [Clostridia bacterium]